MTQGNDRVLLPVTAAIYCNGRRKQQWVSHLKLESVVKAKLFESRIREGFGMADHYSEMQIA